MGIKYLFGMCAGDGCKKRGVFTAEIKGTSKKNGKPLKKKFRLCNEHAKEFIRMGTIKSVTYEETLNF